MPRAPTSLQAQAEERANQDHTRRLAEIKAMAPLLARLDVFVPALKERGLEVYLSGLRLHTEHRDGKQQRVLRIDTCGILDSRKPARWLEVLLALGFTEVSRSNGVYPQAVLRHGHLRLKVDVPETAAQRAAHAAAYAQRAAVAAAAESANKLEAKQKPHSDDSQHEPGHLEQHATHGGLPAAARNLEVGPDALLVGMVDPLAQAVHETAQRDQQHADVGHLQGHGERQHHDTDADHQQGLVPVVDGQALHEFCHHGAPLNLSISSPRVCDALQAALSGTGPEVILHGAQVELRSAQ